MSEWHDLVQFSREESKPLHFRESSAPDSSTEWQSIIAAGITPFEQNRRDKDNLSSSS